MSDFTELLGPSPLPRSVLKFAPCSLPNIEAVATTTIRGTGSCFKTDLEDRLPQSLLRSQ
jgi:hypothetical protein